MFACTFVACLAIVSYLWFPTVNVDKQCLELWVNVDKQ